MKDDLRIELSRTKDRKFYLDPYEYVDDSLWRISQRNWKKRIWEKEIGTFNQLRVEFSRSIDKVSVGYIAYCAMATFREFLWKHETPSRDIAVARSSAKLRRRNATRPFDAAPMLPAVLTFHFLTNAATKIAPPCPSFLSHAIKDACRVSMFSRLFGSV